MPLSLFRADGPSPDALVRAPLMAGVMFTKSQVSSYETREY